MDFSHSQNENYFFFVFLKIEKDKKIFFMFILQCEIVYLTHALNFVFLIYSVISFFLIIYFLVIINIIFGFLPVT